MSGFFKYTDPDNRTQKKRRLAGFFNAVSKGWGCVRKSAKVAFNVASVSLIGASLLYIYPQSLVSDFTPDSITQGIRSYKTAIEDYALQKKEQALVNLMLVPNFNINANDLTKAKQAAQENRERLARGAMSNGAEGAKKIFDGTDLPWEAMCLSIKNLDTIDQSRFSKGQQELYDALMLMRMSPTARYLMDFAKEKDVHMCYQNLGALVNGNYQHFFYTINIDALDIKTMAHELGHHWQGSHNLIFNFRDDLSYEQAYTMELSIESAARVLGALVNKEVELAKEHGGLGYQASFDEIKSWEGVGNLRSFMANEYSRWLSSENWLDSYAEQFDSNKTNKALPMRSGQEMEQRMRAQILPTVGHAFEYGNFLSKELVNKTINVTKSEIQKRDANKPSIRNN